MTERGRCSTRGVANRVAIEIKCVSDDAREALTIDLYGANADAERTLGVGVERFLRDEPR